MERLSMTSKKDKEIVHTITQAASEYFDIASDLLLEDKNHRTSYIRRLCWYLIKNNTMLNYNEIGAIFKMNFSNIYRGVETIDAQKNTYSIIAQDLKNISIAANNFEKKFEWQLPLL
jgi:chromosomal replication initiation ATPase DnaA